MVEALALHEVSRDTRRDDALAARQINRAAFFDTNMLLYATLRPDERSETARTLLAQGGMVRVQVLNELAAKIAAVG